jgi:FkbM family methyltransferase
MHHPVFSRFERFRGTVPTEFHVNFLGVMTRNAYTSGLFTARGWHFPPSGLVEPTYPLLDDEYFEWIDTLEAVLDAKQRFTAIELGAGFGRWLVNAAAAARQQRPDLEVRLIGVEAEPTHFQWMKQHFRDNGLDPEQHQLLEAAIDGADRTCSFYVGRPDEWWGQSIADPRRPITDASVRQVETFSLKRLLSGLELVDLIDLDIEGAELVVLSSAIDELDRKVKRVHIGTHTREIERGLRALFWQHGWHKKTDAECDQTEPTEWGEIAFQNGVQTWINPRLASVPPSAGEVDELQAALCSADRRHSRALDEAAELRGRVEALENVRGKLEANLARAREELRQAGQALGLARGRISAMESSKFWKARRAWFRLKRRLGSGAME